LQLYAQSSSCAISSQTSSSSPVLLDIGE
jgi:hypothetical protein